MRQVSTLLLSVCFLLSGAAGLVYEVVWERCLRCLVGNTTEAVTAVLVAFMGGLAAGGWMFGRVADRSRDRVGIYAFLELGCCLYALAFPFLLSAASAVHAAAIRGLEESTVGLSMARLALASLLLLPPAALMGGTMPLAARHLGATRALPLLYAANSAGAVGGCLAAGYWLIERRGASGTLSAAALLGAAAALLALIVRRLPLTEVEVTSEAKPAGEELPARAGLLAGVFLSGLAAMCLELGWTRLFALIVGSSVHAFASMLAAFIAGIAAGTFSLGEPKDARSARLGFIRGQALIGLLAVASIPVFALTADIFVSLRLARDWSWAAYRGLELFALAGLMFPITFFFGRTFPLAVRAEAARPEGRTVGTIYAANSAGTLLGAVLAGMILIPTIGIRHTLEAGAVASLAAASLAAIGLVSGDTWIACAVAAGSVASLFGAVSPGWSPVKLTEGSFRVQKPSELTRSGDGRELLYYREDSITTVSVEKTPKRHLALRVNGKVDASTVDYDMVTQMMLAHVPLLLRPAARDVLVIGLGSGTTCSSALEHPLASLDCVELSEAVVGAKELFGFVNHRFWKDPRARLLVNDARSFLQGTPRAYDCIVSEPSNPWVAGVASLFTVEFFELARAKLRPGGVMAQWIQTYETNELVLRTILRTFTRSFPHARLFRVGPGDVEVIGSEGPLEVSTAALACAMKTPAIAYELGATKVKSASDLLARQILNEEELKRFTGPGPLNTDDRPLIEYMASRAFFEHAKPLILR